MADIDFGSMRSGSSILVLVVVMAVRVGLYLSVAALFITLPSESAWGRAEEPELVGKVEPVEACPFRSEDMAWTLFPEFKASCEEPQPPTEEDQLVVGLGLDSKALLVPKMGMPIDVSNVVKVTPQGVATDSGLVAEDRTQYSVEYGPTLYSEKLPTDQFSPASDSDFVP
jgi:hypothetical protein